MNTPRTDSSIVTVDVAFIGTDGVSLAPEDFVEVEVARELETELEAVKATLRGSRAPRIYEENEKLKAILRAVKAYPFVPQGLVAMVEKMEAGQ